MHYQFEYSKNPPFLIGTIPSPFAFGSRTITVSGSSALTLLRSIAGAVLGPLR